MKKFLTVFLVLLALVVGFLFYQRQQVSSALRDLLQGQTYSSYGIKIEIPPTEAEVQGWIKPYVNIPRVILDLSAWGLETPINLENAVAVSELWSQGGILLEVPRELSPGFGVKILKPYAELSASEAILAIGSESLVFYKQRGTEDLQSSENIQVLSPQWLLGKISGTLPDRLEFSWQALEYQEAQNKKDPSRIGLGPLVISLTSKKSGERRGFNFEIRQEPGSGKNKQMDFELGALEFQGQGDLKEFSGKEREKIFQKLKSLKYSLTDLVHSPSEDGGSFSAAMEKPHFTKQLSQFYQKFFQIFLDLDLQFPQADFYWEGIKVANTHGELEFLMGPWDFKQIVRYGQEDFFTDLEGKIQNIKIYNEGKPIVLEGFRYQQSSDYKGLNYREIFELYLGGNGMDLFYGDPQVFTDPQKVLKLILNYLVVYPNHMQLNFSVDRLKYQTTNWSADYQNLLLSLQLKPEGFSFELKNALDLLRLNAADNIGEAKENHRSMMPNLALKQSIDGGQDRFYFAIKFPWEKLLNFSRRVTKEEEIAENLYAELYALLAEEEIQGDLDLLLDLGKNYFSFQFNSETKVPAAESGTPLQNPRLWTDISYEQFLEIWTSVLREAWLQKGSTQIDIKIDRFSKFQKFLDEFKPGTSLALALLAPYVQIDSKADTLKSQLQYKDRQILVNGVPNEALNKMVGPYFEKSQ